MGRWLHAVAHGRSQSCGVLATEAAVAAGALSLARAVRVEQFVDEARGFDFVEDAHAFAEACDREGLDVGFSELVFFNELQDQILLLVGTFPRRSALPIGNGGDVGRLAEMMLCGVAGFGWIHAVVSGRNKASAEHLLVHVGLEELIETRGLCGDVGGGAQFRFNRDGELVGGIIWKTHFFTVVGDKFDGHGCQGGWLLGCGWLERKGPA